MPVLMSSNRTFHIIILLAGLAICVAPRGSYAQVPAAPTDARTVIRGENSVDLTWIDNSNDEVAFDVFRSDGDGELRLLTGVDMNLTLFQDRASGLVPDVEYCYEVTARNSSGSSDPSNLACTTIPPRPVSPSGLITSRKNNNSPVALTWIVNSRNEKGFLIYRDIGDTGAFVLEDTVEAGIGRYDDLIVREAVRYCYFVSAFNISGESEGSNISCVDITAEDPALPTLFETEPLSGSDVKITWEFDLVTHSELTLERNVGGLDPWIELLRTTELVTKYLDSNLDSFTEYCYRLVLESASGARAMTDIECSQTEFTVPPVPHNVSADGLEGRSIFLSWSLAPSPQVLFRIERRDGLGPYQLLADSVDAFRLTDDGLLDNEIYCYRVMSFNPEFASDFGSIACAIVAPSPVVNLRVTAGPVHQTREITASWLQGTGTPATSFEVSHKATGSGEFSPPTVTNGLSLLIEGLAEAVEYEVQVVAFRARDSLSENSGPEFATGATFLGVWPGDMDDDGSVTANDIVVLTSPECFGMSTNLSTDGLDVSWSERAVDPSGLDETVIRCDADQNGNVDIFDFLAIAANAGRQTSKGASKPVAQTPVKSESHRARLQQIYESFVPTGGEVGQEKLKKDLAEILRKAGTEIIPDELSLGFSFPNPARGHAVVPVELPDDVMVNVSVFDATGRRVMRLTSEHYHAGRHEISFEASALPPGVYFIVLETDGVVLSQPVIVVQ